MTNNHTEDSRFPDHEHSLDASIAASHSEASNREPSGLVPHPQAIDLNERSPDQILHGQAESLLLELLDQSGKVSVKAFKQKLASQITDETISTKTSIDSIVVRLKYTNNTDQSQSNWKHHGRSFYTIHEYEQQVLDKVDTDAREAENSANSKDEPEVIESESQKRVRSQKEARLGRYIVDALDNIYYSDYTPDETDIAFDVHKQNSGGKFENVDAIAVDWVRPDLVEIVTVEVKLKFNAELVQQASNYRRFSHRVWIAVPIEGSIADSCSYLRGEDRRLFECVLDMGIGILACRMRQGGRYEVAPVHWPQRQNPNRYEKVEFLQRYHDIFVNASISPDHDTRFPSVL